MTPVRGIAIATSAAALAVLGISRLASGGTMPIPAPTREAVAVPPTSVGINLYGLATYNREPVFANLVKQSEWFVDAGHGWSPMPAARLDEHGWVRALGPGEVAPRPLMLPRAPFGTVRVSCTFAGKGTLSAGGIARVRAEGARSIDLDLVSEGGANEGAWIQLDRTDPADPLRDIDCRDPSRPADERFDPAFVASLEGFAAVRFLDWQNTNLNRRVPWAQRTRPDDSSALTGDGAAIEDMVALANAAAVDPWFLMPYDADDAYIQGFAAYVHDHLAPGRIVYVELGNEVWNDMFAATMQARREGLATGLSDDPVRAQTLRYAQKTRNAMRIWTRVYTDRPAALVRVASTLNVWPELAEMLLGYEDMARWVDALATAPYIHLDLDQPGGADVDAIFARLGPAVEQTIAYAERNKAVAARHGKRYITYEGGQHLVIRDMDLARRVQRDPRMAAIYGRYLAAWKTRIGDRLMLYASTAPIGEAGAWGLREYAGQPIAETPKLRAVDAFLAKSRS